MADSDLIDLYSGRILELAADIPLTGRLDDAEASVARRSPLCGSTVTVDLRLADGRVAAFAQDVRACALGQAAASVLGRHVLGLDRAGIERGRDQLRAMLKEAGPEPDAPFSELRVLMPARAFQNRHMSILLAFEATLEAFDRALRAACA